MGFMWDFLREIVPKNLFSANLAAAFLTRCTSHVGKSNLFIYFDQIL